ncbi:MAG: sigma-54 dependent transcriptional regulator [Syntrophorhabdales bacterium]
MAGLKSSESRSHERSVMAEPARILVVDDEQDLLHVLQELIETAGYKVIAVTNEREALQAARSEAFDLSIVDLYLENSNGIALMGELLLLQPDTPVIILTGYGTIETAVESMKQGAYSYLTKPFQPRDLLLHIEKALENGRLVREINRLKELIGATYGLVGVVARSKKMQQVLATVSRVAGSDSTVYIHGESGTGKELIAKTIHVASPRRDKPFIALNCAALPEALLESTLFGHEKGAFTGAIQASRGVFAQAHQGTLFLDEIGDMPLGIQAKILRVLQERRFYPIGSEKIVQVDVRVVVATNKDLEEEVRRGLFRGDLFYRIHVIPIYLPPLKERREDIPALIEHFLHKLDQQTKKGVKTLTAKAMRKLMLHDWPGNIRELQNVLEYAAAMAGDGIITENLVFQPTHSTEEGSLRSLKEAKETFERDYLIKVLQACRGNISETASIVGKRRTDFYALLQKHKLKPADFRPAGGNGGSAYREEE